MKIKTILPFFAAIIFTSAVMGQDVDRNLNSANESYSSGNLENTRFALQEALNGVNQTIGQEILDLLPETLGDMSIVENSDNVTGTNTGFAGLFVRRDYSSEISDASFEIVSDSPMLGSISSLLTMSSMFMSDPNQKRIKLDNYKALMTRNDDGEGDVSYEVQLPFGSSLMTIEITGIDDEDEVMDILAAIPVEEIVDTAR